MSKDQDSKASQDGSCGDSRSPSSKRKATGQIDLDHALHAPVRVNQDGRVRALDPYEAMLRQHVRKALARRSVPSMKFILAEAERHKLIAPLQAPLKGGVFTVPKNLPKDIERAIWDDDGYLETGTISITRIVLLLAKVHTFDRIRRCFNGHRD